MHKERRQAQWREHLERQAQSGQSVAAFCRSEGIAVPTFKRLAKNVGTSTASAATTAIGAHERAPFIAPGTLGAAAPAAGFDIRLALPGGLVLTLTAR
ncbi:MAG TPA: hypothetical protein VIG66_04610 [Noviherbaspirillum sp.]